MESIFVGSEELVLPWNRGKSMLRERGGFELEFRIRISFAFPALLAVPQLGSFPLLPSAVDPPATSSPPLPYFYPLSPYLRSLIWPLFPTQPKYLLALSTLPPPFFYLTPSPPDLN